jgi:hypothetical protein
MNKLIVGLMLAAFALVPSLPADEGKPCDKDKAGDQGCCPAGQKKGCCPKDGAQKAGPAKDKAPEKSPEKAPETK